MQVLPNGNDVFDALYLLEQLKKLVLDETATATQRIHTQWSLDLKERVQKGIALNNLSIVERHRNGDLELYCPNNQSRFREGDQLLLNRGNPFEEPGIHVSFEKEAGDALFFKPDEKTTNWGDVERYTHNWVLDEDILDLSSFYLRALDTVPRTSVGQSRILPLFLGKYTALLNMNFINEMEKMAEASGLNQSQSDALCEAYATDLAYLIQGPPGTGKTHVLAELVHQLVTDGERVLITSFTHRAINNALRKIKKQHPHLHVAKIGLSNHAKDLNEPNDAALYDELLIENYEYFGDSPFVEFVEAGFVVGATPFAGQTSRLQGTEFDTIIFDEASQVTVNLAIMAMLKGTDEARYIFVGDEKQMPPVLLTRNSDNIMHQSVFAFLKSTVPHTMLATTYRMNAELTEWSSRHFYDGQLVADTRNHDRRIQYPLPQPDYTEILDPHYPKVFIDIDTDDTTVRNPSEARLIAHLVLTLLTSGISAKEIGVVAPYRKQGRAIRAALRAILPPEKHPLLQDIIIDTVERIQGQEREIVLVSLTTSSSAFAEGIKEFFFQPERLNVSITRAKSKMIILGSSRVISSNLQNYPPAALLLDLLNSCHLINGKTIPEFVR